MTAHPYDLPGPARAHHRIATGCRAITSVFTGALVVMLAYGTTGPMVPVLVAAVLFRVAGKAHAQRARVCVPEQTRPTGATRSALTVLAGRSDACLLVVVAFVCAAAGPTSPLGPTLAGLLGLGTVAAGVHGLRSGRPAARRDLAAGGACVLVAVTTGGLGVAGAYDFATQAVSLAALFVVSFVVFRFVTRYKPGSAAGPA